jgi:hypothetical protein
LVLLRRSCRAFVAGGSLFDEKGDHGRPLFFAVAPA